MRRRLVSHLARDLTGDLAAAPAHSADSLRVLAGHMKRPRRCRGLGVSDGARTRDNRDHNPVLYQLSYTHQVRIDSGALRPPSLLRGISA